MRIISGRFRGHQLVSFKEDHIRPTTDRVKESIFNKLQGLVEGATVLDLFSGTGNLALEALSRGAERIVAVELSRKSIAIINKNLEKLGAVGAIEVDCCDVLKYLRKYQGPPFDLIFADPPFTEKLANQVLEELSKSSVVGADSTIVIESSSHETVLSEYASLQRFDQRDYGDKNVSYFRRVAVGTSDSAQEGE